jgi:hypothetical protein
VRKESRQAPVCRDFPLPASHHASQHSGQRAALPPHRPLRHFCKRPRGTSTAPELADPVTYCRPNVRTPIRTQGGRNDHLPESSFGSARLVFSLRGEVSPSRSVGDFLLGTDLPSVRVVYALRGPGSPSARASNTLRSPGSLSARASNTLRGPGSPSARVGIIFREPLTPSTKTQISRRMHHEGATTGERWCRESVSTPARGKLQESQLKVQHQVQEKAAATTARWRHPECRSRPR